MRPMSSYNSNTIFQISLTTWLYQICHSYAHNTNLKCNILLKNIVETLNAYIKKSKDKPIITMMEIIRRQLMKRFHVKRNGMMQYSQIVCPRILQKLKFSKTNSRICLTNFGGHRTFEVKHCDGNQNVVNLFKRTCKCKS